MRTAKEYKELSIKEFTKAAKIYDAKFTFGVKNGKALADMISSFSYVEEHSLAEGMSEFVPVFKILKKIPFIANLSNKIIVLRK